MSRGFQAKLLGLFDLLNRKWLSNIGNGAKTGLTKSLLDDHWQRVEPLFGPLYSVAVHRQAMQPNIINQTP